MGGGPTGDIEYTVWNRTKGNEKCLYRGSLTCLYAQCEMYSKIEACDVSFVIVTTIRAVIPQKLVILDGCRREVMNVEEIARGYRVDWIEGNGSYGWCRFPLLSILQYLERKWASLLDYGSKESS